MTQTRPKPNMLIADDDETVRNLLDYHAQKRGFEPELAIDGKDFQTKMHDKIDVVLLDLNMPHASGLQCLEFLQEKYPEIPAVILSSANELETAVEAMKSGASDYLTKPFDLDEVFHVLRRAIKFSQLKQENEILRGSFSTPTIPAEGLIGNSEETKILARLIEKVAGLDSTVLIRGESGVGKGLIARTIHRSSTRRNSPFVTVNCPAMPRELLESELFGHEKGAFTGAHQRRIGKIEMAKGGTLFLDEIGDLPIDLQPKLLNVLQDKEFQRVGGSETIKADIRIITATNVDLEAMVKTREFREDLFYRLNVIPLEALPLRERVGDISPLCDFFLGKISSSREISPAIILSPDALKEIERYDWPGNVRQVENILERASAFCEMNVIQKDDLPPEILQSELDDTTLNGSNLANIPLKTLERIAIMQTLKSCQGNKAEAARRLGVTEKSVYNKMKRFGLGRPVNNHAPALPR